MRCVHADVLKELRQKIRENQEEAGELTNSFEPVMHNIETLRRRMDDLLRGRDGSCGAWGRFWNGVGR